MKCTKYDVRWLNAWQKDFLAKEHCSTNYYGVTIMVMKITNYYGDEN